MQTGLTDAPWCKKVSFSQPTTTLLSSNYPYCSYPAPSTALPPSLPPPFSPIHFLHLLCYLLVRVHSYKPLLQHGLALLSPVLLHVFPCQIYLSFPLLAFSSPTSYCCYVPLMLWWLLLWKGEMIQAPGMRGRAAAGDCTCSPEKTSWRVHVQSVHVCIYHASISQWAHIFLINLTPPFFFFFSFFWPTSSFFSPRHIHFPSYCAYVVPTLPRSNKRIKISVRCLEEQSTQSWPFEFLSWVLILWETAGSIFVLQWQEYPRHTSIIAQNCIWHLGVTTPLAKRFSKFNLAKTAILIEGFEGKGLKI